MNVRTVFIVLFRRAYVNNWQILFTVIYLVYCNTTVLKFILTQVLQVLSTFSRHLPMPLLQYLQSGFLEGCREIVLSHHIQPK